MARRDLTDDQRAIIWASFMKYRDPQPAAFATKAEAGKTGGRGHRKNHAENPPHGLPNGAKPKRAPDVRQRLATQAGVSEHKARQALTVATTMPDEVFRVAKGELKLNAALKRPGAKAQEIRTPKCGDVARAIDKATVAIARWFERVEAQERKQLADAIRELVAEHQGEVPRADP